MTDENSNNNLSLDKNKMSLLNDLIVPLSIEIGRAQLKIKDLLSLAKGSVIELDKAAGDPVDIYANGKVIARGNIISANGKYCVKLITVEMTENSQEPV